VGSQVGQEPHEASKSEGTQAGGTLQGSKRKEQHHILTSSKSIDYPDMDMVREAELRAAHHLNLNNNNNNDNNNNNNNNSNRRSKSKSTDDVNVGGRGDGNISLDSNTLKRMLKPMPSVESPVTSPEMTRRRYNYYSGHHGGNNNGHHVLSEPESSHHHHKGSGNRISSSRSSHEIGRGGGFYSAGRGLYLELERNGSGGDVSPPSDNFLFDNQCYATTPSSSNGHSDLDQPSHYHNSTSTPTPGSPTSRLLLEYEMHLRNTLAKGMDAESYSLHTFEALLSQSMENLGKSLSCSRNWSADVKQTDMVLIVLLLVTLPVPLVSEAMSSVVSLGHLPTRQLTDATACSSATHSISHSLTHSLTQITLVIQTPTELAT